MPLEKQDTDGDRSPVPAERTEWGDGLTSIYHGGEEGQWIQVLDPSIEVDLAEYV